MIKEAQWAEEEEVAEVKDETVDDLAKKLDQAAL